MALSSPCCLPTSPDLRSWNKLIKKLVLEGNAEGAILTFKHMHETCSISVDNFTYPVLLKAVCALSLCRLGLTLHGQIVKAGFDDHPFVQTSVLNMYSAFQRIHEARKVFDQMFEKDVVAWNSMLDGYVLCSRIVHVMELFDSMPKKGVQSFNIMVYGYACVKGMSCARRIFDKIPETERDTVSWNSMILACCNFGDMQEARALFEKMPQRNVISWNTLLAAFLRNGLADEVITLFERMKAEDFASDHLTITTVLSAKAVNCIFMPKI